MPGKNSKQTSAKTETPVAPKVEAAPAQKGGKKVAAASEAKTETPVVPKVEAAPAQKGGKKVAAASSEVKTETPVAPKVEAAPAQKGGKKAAASSGAKTEAPAQKGGKKAAASSGAKTEAPAQKGGKKAAPAKAKAEKPAKVAKKAESEEEGDESGDRRIRSFKVKLPNKEDFEGRFTGLTPYQAANKALSKYFRETDKPKSEITFSICESTRKSKKTVYTYVGKRQKLDTPVSYKIQDGREIVKNFKNSLKKVKKSEAPTESA